MRQILFIVLFLLVIKVGAQEKNSDYALNIDVGLPVPSGNDVFKDIMDGLVCINFCGQYSLPFNLNFALGLRYSLFTINEFAINQENNGQLHLGAAFLKLGYNRLHTNRFATDFGVKIGYSLNYANTYLNEVAGVNPISYDALIVEPTIGLIVFVDRQNSYRLNIGYCLQGYGFEPSTIGLLSNSSYDASQFSRFTNYFVVGFGYTHYFGKNKSN